MKRLNLIKIIFPIFAFFAMVPGYSRIAIPIGLMLLNFDVHFDAASGSMLALAWFCFLYPQISGWAKFSNILDDIVNLLVMFAFLTLIATHFQYFVLYPNWLVNIITLPSVVTAIIGCGLCVRKIVGAIRS